jgi:hypothetical protein
MKSDLLYVNAYSHLPAALGKGKGTQRKRGMGSVTDSVRDIWLDAKCAVPEPGGALALRSNFSDGTDQFVGFRKETAQL